MKKTIIVRVYFVISIVKFRFNDFEIVVLYQRIREYAMILFQNFDFFLKMLSLKFLKLHDVICIV